MKKLLALALLPLLLTGCKKEKSKDYKTFDVISYVYSYQTSEVQEYTHDCKLAQFRDDERQWCYVEVPTDRNEYPWVQVKKTNKSIWYRIYDTEEKVSNNGWEFYY